jgi:chromosome segregation ATPase
MKPELTASELRLRLERLDRHLSAAADKVLEGGAAMADRQRQVEILRLKASLLRQRLEEAKATGWGAVKTSLEADWDALSENLERWMKNLDKDFQPGTRRQ